MSNSNDSRPRNVVIGCGSIGRRHIGNLVALRAGEILAFDVQPDRRRDVESRLGVETVSDLQSAWDRGVSVAIIATPTSLHVPQALEAARHGCDLFIEKPLSDRWDSHVENLLKVAANAALVTLVGCNMRFHPGPARVKRLIEEGAIGRVLFARLFGGSYLPDWHPWEDYREGYSANASMGGGCVLDGIHELDLARWYLGEVTAVTAMVTHASGLEMDVEDLASIILRHQGGQQSEVHLDYVQRARIRGCVIAGSEGTVTWDWTEHRVRLYTAARKSWAEEPLPANWDTNQMYMDEMAHFLECRANRAQTCNPIAQAAAVTRIALEAKRASQEGRTIALAARAV